MFIYYQQIYIFKLKQFHLAVYRFHLRYNRIGFSSFFQPGNIKREIALDESFTNKQLATISKAFQFQCKLRHQFDSCKKYFGQKAAGADHLLVCKELTVLLNREEAASCSILQKEIIKNIIQYTMYEKNLYCSFQFLPIF